MSARLGNPQLITAAAAALGVAAGRTISLGNGAQWALLLSLVLTYVVSATAGNRIVILTIKDAAGNIVWQNWNNGAVNITAGAAAKLIAPVWQSNSSGGGGVPQDAYFLPDQMAIPPNSTLTVQDLANIDVNDTVQLNSAALSY